MFHCDQKQRRTVRHGKGTCTYANGDEYEGEFHGVFQDEAPSKKRPRLDAASLRRAGLVVPSQ